MASTDARPMPLKNTAFRVYFPILDADGDPVTGASGLDSEVSLDGGSFSDCTNEATEVGSSGVYYLDLTSGEMNGDAVCVQVKTSTSGAKTTVLVMYPAETGDIPVNVTAIEGSDPTDQIRDAVVDDATRIDASALNTASGAIGSNGSGLTEAGGTGDHLTAVPWNASWDAEVQSEATDALNAYDAPTRAEATADKNEILGLLSGLVLATSVIGSTGNDTTHIHLDGLTYGDDEINDLLLIIYDASAAEYHSRWIDDWVASTELATVETLPFTPQNATDSFYLLPTRRDVSGGGGGLDAAGVRAAIGLASANLDDQLGDIPTVAELGSEIDVVENAIAGLNDLSADDVWDEAVDGTVTARQSLRLANAANGGKLSGAATSTNVLRDPADSKDRITATVDEDGNRTAVTLDLT